MSPFRSFFLLTCASEEITCQTARVCGRNRASAGCFRCMHCGTLCKFEENALAVIDSEAFDQGSEMRAGEPVFLKVSRSNDGNKNRVDPVKGQS